MIKTAGWFVLLWMRLFSALTKQKIVGWTSLWDVIYLAPGHENDKGLIAHESTHLAQMQRDGKLRFALRYLWFSVRYSYADNPYEVEARQVQAEALK